MSSRSSEDVFIVSAARTPIGRFGGALAQTSATELGSTAIAAAVERAAVPFDAVDEVYMGQVLQAGAGQSPARQAALGAGLPETVPATTINRVCGSGLKAIMLAAAAIKAGDAEVLVAACAADHHLDRLISHLVIRTLASRLEAARLPIVDPYRYGHD